MKSFSDNMIPIIRYSLHVLGMVHNRHGRPQQVTSEIALHSVSLPFGIDMAEINILIDSFSSW